MGLADSQHEPCVYMVSLIPWNPPVYVGLYLDEFVYFRKFDVVEEQFKTSLSMALQVDRKSKAEWFLSNSFE